MFALLLGLAWLASGAPIRGLPFAGNDAARGDGTYGGPPDVLDPVEAGEPTPAGFRQLLRRDAIPPIYEPAYVPAGDVRWEDGTLVIGVAIDGDARAYPVSALNRREIVNGEAGGVPYLATW